MNWVAPIKDQETLKNFGETLKQVDYKYYIMFELGVGTGLQLQDILAFKNKDVTGKKEIEVTIGTRNMKNVFTVPEELQQIINEYTKGKDPEAYLILGHSSSNKPVSREQAYRVLRSAGHKIGLNSIGAQTMRKTYAWNYYKETVFLKKTTPQENERSRYLLYLNDNGKKKLNKIIDTLTGIRDNFDSPANNDAFYGKVDCLLQELEALMENYQNTK